MVDLGGYVIILVETSDKRVKLYGSPADKAELEVADEILEINGKPLNNSTHPEVINHIHNCIKSRTICLRVKRRTGNKLAEELSENSNVQDAFVIAVEQQARERLEKLSALRKIKPVDMTALSQELCENDPSKAKTTASPVKSTCSSKTTFPANSVDGSNSKGSTHSVQAVLERGDCGNSSQEALDKDISSKQRNRSRDSSRDGINSVDSVSASVRSRNSSLDSVGHDTEDTKSGQSSAVVANSASNNGSCRRRQTAPTQQRQSRRDGSGGNAGRGAKQVALAERLSVGDDDRTSTSSPKHQRQRRDIAATSSHPGEKVGVGPDQGRTVNSKVGSTHDAREQNAATSTQPSNNIREAVKKLEKSMIDGSAGSRSEPASQQSSNTHSASNTNSGDVLPNDLPSETSGANISNHQTSIETSGDDISNHQSSLETPGGQEVQKEVLIGGDTEENRSARGSVRERHQVKTFSERKDDNGLATIDPSDSLDPKATKPLLRPTHSLKAVVDVEELSRCVERVTRGVGPPRGNSAVNSTPKHATLPHQPKDTNSTTSVHSQKLSSGKSCHEISVSEPQNINSLDSIKSLMSSPLFKRLMSIHNTIQLVQCFRCPPPPLCLDSRDLVQECMLSLQGSHLPEAAEILDILNRIELEGLFYSHDKLAELQGGLPWKKCLAEMWTKERAGSSTPDSNTRVVRITKHNEPLGATVRNEGEKVVIGRVVKGGAAERSGCLHPGDEVLEVNGLRVKGKSVHDICSTLCQMSGTLTFVIIPANLQMKDEETQPVYHYRAHFTYVPDDDLYIPCHELGIAFQRGDILHVISKDDPHWWQAYRDGEWTQTLAGLIPSLSLQQHRNNLQKQKKDQELRERAESPGKKKSAGASSLLCAKKSGKRRPSGSPYRKDTVDVLPYEEMALYYPNQNQKRPLILVGPPSIGRHELRQRLLDDTNKFAAPVPHTTRSRGEGEIDSVDYHFVSKTQFEAMVQDRKFLEHGEYDRQMYGTSIATIRTVLASGKICVLNVQPSSLPAFHDSDLKPYVVFLTPPSPQVYKNHKQKNGELYKDEEYRELVMIAHNMEETYGHYFDSVIPFEDVDYVFKQVMYEISLLEREPQWVPAKWVQNAIKH